MQGVGKAQSLESHFLLLMTLTPCCSLIRIVFGACQGKTEGRTWWVASNCPARAYLPRRVVLCLLSVTTQDLARI